MDARQRDRNVVLTGFMGTGKTTVGRLLARALDFEFVDTDAVIVDRHGPIPTIFAEHGEGRFRQLEREVVEQLAATRRTVISTGGRLMLDPVNAHALGETGTVFCLSAPLDVVLARIDADGGGATRPMLADGDAHERVAALFEQRRAAYADFAQVSTGERTPDEIVADIVNRLTVD